MTKINFKNGLFIASAVCILFLAGKVYAKSGEVLELVYENKIATTYNKGCEVTKKGKIVPLRPAEKLKQVIYIGADKFSLSTEKFTRIYDFKTRKITTLDKQKKTFLIHSLYADPAFKSAEKKNREMMLKVFSGGGFKCSDRLIDAEMIFSMADKDSPTWKKLKEKKDANDYRFIFEGEEIAKFSRKGFFIPKEYKKIYNKYVLYIYSLHPKIRKNLLRQKVAPKMLQYKFKSFGNKEHTYRLIKSKIVTGNYFSIPQSYKRIYSNQKELNDIIAKSFEQSNIFTKSFLKKENKKFMAEKNYIAAVMVFIQYTLIHGNSSPDILRSVKFIVKNHPQSMAVKFLSSMNGKSKEDVQRGVKNLEEIRASKAVPDNYLHVLDVFLANLYPVLGEKSKGKSIMLRALKGNPFLIGAYKDLGDMYYRDWFFPDTWVCWDRARELSPSHPMFSKIDAYEKNIETRFPEYF